MDCLLSTSFQKLSNPVPHSPPHPLPINLVKYQQPLRTILPRQSISSWPIPLLHFGWGGYNISDSFSMFLPRGKAISGDALFLFPPSLPRQKWREIESAKGKERGGGDKNRKEGKKGVSPEKKKRYRMCEIHPIDIDLSGPVLSSFAAYVSFVESRTRLPPIHLGAEEKKTGRRKRKRRKRRRRRKNKPKFPPSSSFANLSWGAASSSSSSSSSPNGEGGPASEVNPRRRRFRIRASQARVGLISRSDLSFLYFLTRWECLREMEE